MASTTAPTPTTDTVRSILAEAQHLFAERGFDGVSISDLASVVGVSKANIFHHFGTKQALYLEALKSCLSEFGALADHLKEDEDPIEGRLQHFMRDHAANVDHNPEAAKLVLRELLANRDEVSQQLAEEVTREQFRRLLALLQDAQQAGEIRDDLDPAALMLMMIGAVVFLFQVRSLLRHQPEVDFADDPDEYSRLFADILVHGVCPKGRDE